jgi:dTDP-4-dehydrorhamnose 3,5-epimerase
MELEELEIKGAWLAKSPIHMDDRGFFREWFKSSDVISEIGQNFTVAQANISTSNKGVIRGIHFSTALEGQGKWVTCVSGSIWDVVVDIRPESPTFKKWIGTTLNSKCGESIYLSEGLGHSFISLEDNSTVTYMLTSPYSPLEELGIHPLDPDLSISWPLQNHYLSPKDSTSPNLRDLLGETIFWEN